jgi:hypothetical protein
MRTSFHHQPEAQHPKSPAIETPAGRLPHLSPESDRSGHGYELTRSAISDHCSFYKNFGTPTFTALTCRWGSRLQH